MKNLKYFMLVSVLFVSALALAEPPKILQICSKEKTGVKINGKTQNLEWLYCIYKTEGSKNNDVLYHFHGRGNHELETKGWDSKDHYSYNIRNTWAATNFDAPVVVSLTFGDIWLLVEKNESPYSGLYEFATQAAIPTIEAALSKEMKIGKRHLIGESMGGFNASQLLLKSPQGQFSKTALLCPAITTLSPFASEAEVKAYIAETGATPDNVMLMIKLSQYFIPTFADWEKTSPLKLVTKSLNETSGNLYVSCGDKDEYGFFKSAKLFYDSAVANKVAATWVPVANQGHCAVDAKSVAEFFSTSSK